MRKPIFLQKNYTLNEGGYQLKLPLNLESIIPVDDSVRLLSQFVEGMDLTDLYSTYERINSVSPRTLLKIVLYSYMNGDYSSRSMELNCKRDINFMFLLEGIPAPDHATFARFRSIHFAPCSKRILAEMSNTLYDLGEISGRSNLYVYDNNGELIKGNISNVGNVQSIEVLERGCGGVAKRIKIKGSTAECVILGENTIRTVLGSSKETVNTQSCEAHYDILPSAFIVIKPVYADGIAGVITAYNILGGGYGHGIGMSQNAVRKMAETMDYADILKFFYKGVQIKNVNMDE